MDILPTILTHLAWIKLIFFSGVGLLLFLILKKHDKPLDYVLILTAMFGLLTYLIVWPQNTLLFGNSGDELYMGANLSRMVSGSFGGDLYYASLPAYYPPLWFWIVGSASSLVATHGLVAYKISAIAGVIALFFGSYGWLWFAQKCEIFRTHWSIRILIPVSVCALIPFDALIGKPHEALSALLSLFLIAGLIRLLDRQQLRRTHIVFMSCTAAGIMMMYYFWGIVLVPTVIFLCLMSPYPLKNVFRVFGIGFFAALLSAPYIYPLVISLYTHGASISQGTYFSLHDIILHVPSATSFLAGVYAFLGLIAFALLHRLPLVRGAILIIGGSYVYQFLGLAIFVSGLHPLLPSKPFEFLVGMGWAVGLTYALIAAVSWVHQSRRLFILSSVASVILLAVGSPFVTLADNRNFIERMNRNTLVPQEMVLAESIAKHVPDWDERVWLASTRPAVNVYLPLTYFIAHNEHHSHFAAGFSNRLLAIESLAESVSADEFYDRVIGLSDQPSALLLYYDEQTDSFPIDFWIDNFPNGGRTYRVELPARLISDEYFDLVYDEWNWRVYILGS